jgi:hypothetical protein
MDIQHNEHVNDRHRDLHECYEREGLPQYPALGATIAKLRKRAESVCIVHRAVARREHGLAVLEAIRRLNYRSLQRELPEHKSDSQSGTPHNTGKAILAAIAKQHRNHCNPDAIRAKRTIAEISKAYDAAMAEKRARLS